MELAFEETLSLVSVKWSDDLSVESTEFFQTVVFLFGFITEKQVRCLMVDSGVPAGGVLTEEIIDFFTINIRNTPLKHIALLESPDYLWDNNLYQVIRMLISGYQLPITVEMFKNSTIGYKWLTGQL